MVDPFLEAFETEVVLAGGRHWTLAQLQANAALQVLQFLLTLLQHVL